MAVRIKVVHHAPLEDPYRVHMCAPGWPFGMIVLGGTNQGKTTSVLHMLLRMLHFHFLYVFAKNHETTPDYDELKELCREREKKYGKCSLWDNKLDNVPKVSELDPKARNMFIFDDMTKVGDKEKRETIGDYFVAGRKGGASVINIIHGLQRAIDPTSRDQASHFLLFKKVNRKALKEIYETHCSADLSFKQFLEMYNECTRKQGDFLYIDTKAPTIHERYRYQFHWFLDPTKLKNKLIQ